MSYIRNHKLPATTNKKEAWNCNNSGKPKSGALAGVGCEGEGDGDEWGTTTFERIKMPEPVRRCALRPIFATLYPLYMLAGCPNYFETHKRTHTHTRRYDCVCECIVFQVSHVRIELNLQQNVAKGGCRAGAGAGAEAEAVCSSVCARLLSIFSNVFCSGQHTCMHTHTHVCSI